MDWKTAVDAVATHAPTAAAMLGASASGVGVLAGAGKIVTSLLGTDEDPAAVYDLTRTDEGRAKLMQLENDHKVELQRLLISAEGARIQAESDQLQRTHETMRTEITTEGVFKSGWRPAAGWIFSLSIGGIMSAIIVALFRDTSLLSNAEFMDTAVWLFVVLGGALGLNIKQRSNDKARVMGYEPKGFLGSVLTGRNRG